MVLVPVGFYLLSVLADKFGHADGLKIAKRSILTDEKEFQTHIENQIEEHGNKSLGYRFFRYGKYLALLNARSKN